MPTGSEQAHPLLEVTGLTKSFLGQRVLDDVRLTLHRGEIHALLGENGAGKSTLIKAVTGVVQRDAGTVRLDGLDIMPRDSEAAVKAGIATVYQEVNLLPNLSVAENLYLGRQPTRFGLVRNGVMRRDAATLLRGFALTIDVGAPLGDYSVAVQHLVAIARAVDMSARSDAFLRQMDFTADLCLASTPRDPNSPVRLPGQLAVQKKRAAERDGVTLHPGIGEKLAALAARLGVTPLA